MESKDVVIDFERVLKRVLILDPMAHNRLVPADGKTVEDYGHKLRALFGTANAVCTFTGKACHCHSQADRAGAAPIGLGSRDWCALHR